MSDSGNLPVWYQSYAIQNMVETEEFKKKKEGFFKKWKPSIYRLVKKYNDYDINPAKILDLINIWEPWKEIYLYQRSNPSALIKIRMFLLNNFLNRTEEGSKLSSSIEYIENFIQSYELLAKLRHILDPMLVDYFEKHLDDYWLHYDVHMSNILPKIDSMILTMTKEREDYKFKFEKVKPELGASSDYLINYTVIKLVDAVKDKEGVWEGSMHRKVILEFINAFAGYQVFDPNKLDRLRKRIEYYAEKKRKDVIIDYIEKMAVLLKNS